MIRLYNYIRDLIRVKIKHDYGYYDISIVVKQYGKVVETFELGNENLVDMDSALFRMSKQHYKSHECLPKTLELMNHINDKYVGMFDY